VSSETMNFSLGIVPLAKIYGIQKTTCNYKQIINTNSLNTCKILLKITVLVIQRINIC
jgi:hypothetical protein